jgi:tetratricopeptide (TPR) repeat protein
VIAQELARRAASSIDLSQAQAGEQHYYVWLVDRTYTDNNRDLILIQLVQSCLNEMIQVIDHLSAGPAVRYCWQLGRLLRRLGRIVDAMRVLTHGETLARAQQNPGLCRVLFEIARILARQGDIDQALATYAQALGLAQAVQDLSVQAKALHAMADIWKNRGEFDQAALLRTQSMLLRQELGAADLYEQAATLVESGHTLAQKGELEQATRLYEQSLAMQEQLGDLRSQAHTLHELAHLWGRRGRLDLATQLYERSLALKEQLGDPREQAATLHEMAHLWARRGRLDLATQLYERSLAIRERSAHVRGKAAILFHLAGIDTELGAVAQALRRYNESLALREQLGDIPDRAAILSQIAHLIVSEQPDSAEHMLREALTIAERLQDRYWFALSTVRLGQVAQARGDHTAALEQFCAGFRLFDQADTQATRSPESPSLMQARATLTDDLAVVHRSRRVVVAMTQAAPAALFGSPAELRAALHHVYGQIESDTISNGYMATLLAFLDHRSTPAELWSAAQPFLAVLPHADQYTLLQALATLLAKVDAAALVIRAQEQLATLLRAATGKEPPK